MPSPKNPTDPDFSRFDFRPKIHGFPSWKGVVTNGDAASMPANTIRDGVNIRSDAEGYVCRGGQAKGSLNAASGDLDGIWEASDVGVLDGSAIAGEPGTPFNNFYVMGFGASTFGYFTHVNTSSQTVISSDAADDARTTAIPIDYDGEQVGGVQFGETDGVVVSIPSMSSLFVLPRVGSLASPQSLVAVGTNLWVTWYDSGGGQGRKVSLWDGATLTADLLQVGQDNLAILGKLGSTPYLALNPSSLHISNNIYRRDGVNNWTAIALPTATWFQAHHMLEYSGKLWIIGADDVNTDDVNDRIRVYSCDGSTATLERTLVLSGNPHFVSQLGIVGADLYYWYHDGGNGTAFSKIGRYSGAVFTDSYKDLSPNIGSSYVKGMGFVAGTDGADAMYFDDSDKFYVWESPGTNLAGTWTLVLSPTVGYEASTSTTPPVLAGKVAS